MTWMSNNRKKCCDQARRLPGWLSKQTGKLSSAYLLKKDLWRCPSARARARFKSTGRRRHDGNRHRVHLSAVSWEHPVRASAVLNDEDSGGLGGGQRVAVHDLLEWGGGELVVADGLGNKHDEMRLQEKGRSRQDAAPRSKEKGKEQNGKNVEKNSQKPECNRNPDRRGCLHGTVARVRSADTAETASARAQRVHHDSSDEMKGERSNEQPVTSIANSGVGNERRHNQSHNPQHPRYDRGYEPSRIAIQTNALVI